MTRIKILGMGRVGSILASNIIASDLQVSHIYIYDNAPDHLLGECLDLQDMADILKRKISVEIKHAYTEADIYVITAGIPRYSMDEKHDFEGNYFIVKSCLGLCNPKRPVIVATNPKEELKKTIKGKRIIFCGYKLDKSREKRHGMDGELIAKSILNSKGFTAFGISAEIIETIRGLI